MGALRLSAGGGFGAGALACGWGWLGQLGVEEGTFGSTVTDRGTARGEQGVGTRWGGVVGAGAVHVPGCYQNGYVQVLYQGD